MAEKLSTDIEISQHSSCRVLYRRPQLTDAASRKTGAPVSERARVCLVFLRDPEKFLGHRMETGVENFDHQEHECRIGTADNRPHRKKQQSWYRWFQNRD